MKIEYPFGLMAGMVICIIAIVSTIPALRESAVYDIHPVYTFFAGMAVIGFSIKVIK